VTLTHQGADRRRIEVQELDGRSGQVRTASGTSQ